MSLEQEYAELKKSLDLLSGGHTIQRQDIDIGFKRVLTVSEQDFKGMNNLKKQAILNPTKEYLKITSPGKANPMGKYDKLKPSNATYEHRSRTTKIISSLREISFIDLEGDVVDDLTTSEIEMGLLAVAENCEEQLYNGNSDINPLEYDSILKQIKDGCKKSGLNSTLDLRGDTMSSAGDRALNDIASKVYKNGGWLTHSLMPTEIATDVQSLITDRIRFEGKEKGGAGGYVALSYPTTFSDPILISGKNAGGAKMFKMKDVVIPTLSSTELTAPTFTAIPEASTDSLFGNSDAGDYIYQVFPIGVDGIGVGSTISSPVILQKGQQVKLAISNANCLETIGYVIARSQKDGSILKEMIKIKCDGATTTFIDKNEDLPGTGEILLLTLSNSFQRIRWLQFIPAGKYDFFVTDTLTKRFGIVVVGTPDVIAPAHHGIIKNVSYSNALWS